MNMKKMILSAAFMVAAICFSTETNAQSLNTKANAPKVENQKKCNKEGDCKKKCMKKVDGLSVNKVDKEKCCKNDNGAKLSKKDAKCNDAKKCDSKGKKLEKKN